MSTAEDNIAQVHLHLHTLLDQLAEQIPAESLASIQQDFRCGEEGCALHLLFACVYQCRIPLTPKQHHAIKQCIQLMHMHDEIIDLVLLLMEQPNKVC